MTFTTKTRKMTSRKSVKPVTRKQVHDMLHSFAEIKTAGTVSTTASAIAGAVVPISYIVQDDTVNGRTGAVIRPTKLHIRIATWDATENFIRYIIFRDDQNVGVLPTVLNVLNTADYNSPYNYINVEAQRRFKILDDFTVCTSTQGPSSKFTEKTYKLSGTTNYVGAAADAASCGRGQYYALSISAVAAADQSLTLRLYYTDA